MSALNERLAELARIGADEAGGVTRLAFSAEDVAGRELVAGWMRAAGLAVEVDAATNLIGRRTGAGPAIVVGSHLDTVRGGGPLDGAYGVVAAVQAAAELAGTPLRHPLAVVAFVNEEGSVAPPGFTGSRTIAGLPVDVADVVGPDGRTLGDTIRAAGGRPDELAASAWPANAVAAYLELHIEQGPVLENEGQQIGIVEAITGRAVLDITVTGAANHAGTTPMELRQDALVAAAELVSYVRSLTSGVRVATVGQIAAKPNARNVIPGEVTLGVDIRDASDSRVRAAVDRLRARAAGLPGVTVTIREGTFVPAAPAAPELTAALAEVTARRGLRTRWLPSGAGHDAQVMAALAPIAMLFVPSRGGISHSPHEYSEPADLDTGLAVLRDAIVEIDGRLP